MKSAKAEQRAGISFIEFNHDIQVVTLITLGEMLDARVPVKVGRLVAFNIGDVA